MKIYQTFKSKKITVGSVVGGVFRKILKPQHFLFKPPAIAFGIGSLKQAVEAGATLIHITNAATGEQHWATMLMLNVKSFTIERDGFEIQLALTMNHWRKNEAEAIKHEQEVLS